MLTRRAPTNIIVSTIALWVIAGFIPGQTAQAAVSGPACYEQATGPGGGSTIGTQRDEITTSVAGDPDEYAHTGNGTPLPGDGTGQNSGRSFIYILMHMFSVWMSMVWGLPQ